MAYAPGQIHLPVLAINLDAFSLKKRHLEIQN